MTDTDWTWPGKSALAMGPSGAGKSHFLATALEARGSGVVVLAQGLDELESYSQFRSDADILATPADRERLIQSDDDGSNARIVSEAPYLFAAFDDEDFFPSDGDWDTHGHQSAIQFLKLVRVRLREDEAEGREPSWNVLGVDSYSGIGELAHNAMCGKMKRTVPPKARGEGGAQYYIGYRGKLVEFARACRSIRGYGVDWIATSHVKEREASKSWGARDVTASKKQEMPLFTGAFREILPSYFDLVFYLAIGGKGEFKNRHYAQWLPDAFRQAKSRYKMDEEKLDAENRIENDWSKIHEAILDD